jgi:hypothetical protein
VSYGATSLSPSLLAFGSNFVMRNEFSGSPGFAQCLLTTGYAELNEGGRVFISGIKPAHNAAEATCTVFLGKGENLGFLPTYTAGVLQTVRTGWADFRSDTKHANVKLDFAVNQAAAKVTGIEYQYTPSGAA